MTGEGNMKISYWSEPFSIPKGLRNRSGLLQIWALNIQPVLPKLNTMQGLWYLSRGCKFHSAHSDSDFQALGRVMHKGKKIIPKTAPFPFVVVTIIFRGWNWIHSNFFANGMRMQQPLDLNKQKSMTLPTGWSWTGVKVAFPISLREATQGLFPIC